MIVAFAAFLLPSAAMTGIPTNEINPKYNIATEPNSSYDILLSLVNELNVKPLVCELQIIKNCDTLKSIPYNERDWMIVYSRLLNTFLAEINYHIDKIDWDKANKAIVKASKEYISNKNEFVYVKDLREWNKNKSHDISEADIRKFNNNLGCMDLINLAVGVHGQYIMFMTVSEINKLNQNVVSFLENTTNKNLDTRKAILIQSLKNLDVKIEVNTPYIFFVGLIVNAFEEAGLSENIDKCFEQ